MSDNTATSHRLADEELVAQLRTANENLVLATIKAQTLHEQAEAANVRQNEFLAMLAHELRNPLAPISNAAAMLERVATDAALVKIQNVISRQIDHMARLLDDLLDASRISTGKISLQKGLVPLSDVVTRAVEVSQPFIDKRRQVLTVDLPVAGPLVDCDSVRLAQVFSNLLINAAKFTPDEGRISFSAGIDSGELVVMVRDTGTGIAPEVLPHIFELFMQGAHSLDRTDGGLGIGLTVARSLVEGHGGKISARSDGPGKGSEFVVTLPLPLPDAVAQASVPTVQQVPVARRCRVLLVEDNVDANDTLKMLLEYDGHEVSAAYDGKTGFAMAVSQEFDVVVCDIGLPGMSGIEFVQQLRRARRGAGPLVIATSGYGHPDDRSRAIASGFDEYLVKPVAGARLLRLIAAHCETAAASA
jgi:two-component system, sensor histidine kinase